MKILRYAVIGWQITMDPETMQEKREEMPAIIETAWSEKAEAHARQVAMGDVEIYDDGEPDPAEPQAPAGDYVTWDELEAAIREGVQEV